MIRTTIAAAAVTIAAAPGLAGAGLAPMAEPAVLSPIDDAVVTVEWIGSSAGYTGNLNWIDATRAESGDVVLTRATLWDNKSAEAGQSWRIPRLFAQGERVDFEYDIIKGKIDSFSTPSPDDAGQFMADATDPFRVIVGIEDIRLPGGDADFNDAVFAVSFAPAVPAPTGMAIVALGGLLAVRRRR